MPKFFVVSDVHGHFNAMKAALDDAGFDTNNEDHWLISCGDNLDRGRQPNEVIKYLTNLQRCVLIKGNHSNLFLDCINRAYALSHDWSNGTAQTILDLAPNVETFDVACSVAYYKVKPLIDKMVNYFETKNYIFCHGFIPVLCDDPYPPWYRRNRKFSKMENWREATQYQWDDAMWLNSYDMVDQGLGTEKCIVAGHWHTSYGRYQRGEGPEFGEGANFSPFYYDDKLIMIDACTAYSGKANCLVIEDEFITTQN